MCPSQPSISATPRSGLGNDCLNIIAQISRKSKRKFQLFSCYFYTNCTMEFYLKLIFVQLYVSSKDTLCYILLLSHAFPFIFSFSRNYDLHIISRPAQKENPAVPGLLDKPAASDYNTKKSSQTFSLHISAISSGKGFFHGTKTKQYLLITVVGVTLFVALLRLSSVLAFAAQLVDLILPILAGGILALFINVPMTGLEKRLKRLFCKAKNSLRIKYSIS